ncbi:MAG: FAD:protein FMN transferase [Planctomycetota bacterium]
MSVLLPMGFCLTACGVLSGAEDWYAEERTLYGGIPVQVRFTPRDDVLATAAWGALTAFDDLANDWRDDSQIGKINAGGPGTYQLSPELAEMFALSERMRTATDGAFEITVGPLRRMWRGAEKNGHWPTPEAIATVRLSIGPSAYTRAGSELRVLRPGVKFDFGGIKGHAIDAAAAILRRGGTRAALIQISGETACWGISPRGQAHKIAVPNPDAPDDLERMWCRLQDQGEGMCGSTSGNYRQPITVDGRVLYHIYDPRSGQPSDTHVLSVSILIPGAGRSGEADALTKAGVVLGVAGLPLIERAGAQGLLLLRRADGTIEEHTTSGWSRFVVRQAPTPAGSAGR